MRLVVYKADYADRVISITCVQSFATCLSDRLSFYRGEVSLNCSKHVDIKLVKLTKKKTKTKKQPSNLFTQLTQGEENNFFFFTVPERNFLLCLQPSCPHKRKKKIDK